ncbi:acetate/propionate family kinase [Metallibacterium scheffleri]|uniref:Acetate kinase n=1 Tax=Metallibacterium scheffleri TaxID=993689 RepID=A0A4S3KHV8_9GAMM|nr:acetate/propionate family kinase [Metallibacterium scheffleri]THD08120.1 acetate kinase [Metallibacterium scheffleri]
MTCILVLNAGSSSIKFAAFRSGDNDTLELLQQGQLAGIGSTPRLQAHDAAGHGLVDRTLDIQAVPDVAAAEAVVNDWIATHLGAAPDAVGHRVVHGGVDFWQPVRIDAAILDRLAALSALAPLHQPFNLAPIRSLLQRQPQLPQVACFDTAFHHGHAPEMDLYALPQSLIAAGVRRYGFHGLSYEYIAARLPSVAPDLARGRTVIAHLGNGASLCALQGGRSVDSTMGFSALEGLVMGTRPGNLDPGVVLYLAQEQGHDAAQISHLLYHDCGLKGLSGLSGDMRELLASDSAAARLALAVFAHRVAQSVAAMAASMGGLDGIVFTAGIGEHAPGARAAIVQRLDLFGARLDAVTNAGSTGVLDIAAPDSRIALRVIPTDEELMIAQHTFKLLRS